MTLLRIRLRTIILIGVLTVIVLVFAGTWWGFDQAARQSERHQYSYTVDLFSSAAITDLSLLLPVPEVGGVPCCMESILNRTAYGIRQDWNVSIARVNGTPMLSIATFSLVPEYRGTPIAIEPSQTLLPTTPEPAHEYSPSTPVLMPLTIGVVETSGAAINTRDPVGHEPVFFPRGPFTPSGSGDLPPAGLTFTHPVPLYIAYHSVRPTSLSLTVRVEGVNMIWKGGWVSNSYSDTVMLEDVNGTAGWTSGEGQLVTGAGVYYR